MKNIKNIILVILTAFLLSGCELNYKIVINKDLSTSEKLEMTVEEKSITEMTEKYDDSYVNDNLELYKTTAAKEGYKFTYEKGKNIKVTATKNNSSLVLNKDIMKERYKYNDYSCNSKYCMLYAVANNDLIAGDGGTYNLKLSIQVPYKVLVNNADEVDKLTNTYIWYSDVGKENSNIELVFKKDGNDIVKENKVFYFIKVGIFAIIGLLVIIKILDIVNRIKNSRKPII